jgi:carbamoyltransferase
VARLYRDLDGITPTLERLCSGDEPAHVAAAMQSVTEEVITALCADAVTATGIPNLALAGGIFANVKLNQRLLDLDVVDDVYVHPNMGDGGLAAGAALQVAADERPADERLLPSFRSDVYLGPEYTDDEVGAVLQSQGRSFTECDDIEDRVGQLLSEGTVVARHAGRMEYGPRALGNRSLLVQPTDPTVNDWLNARLERTEFMPFAPATLEEHAADFFLGWRPEQVAARFMTITYDTAKSARDQAPATVHVDDTARPQIVRHQDNPSYHRIIDAYRERTGIPSIINTSFNMHEEPIVCTPEDALRALDQGSADVLAINRFLVYPPSG